VAPVVLLLFPVGLLCSVALGTPAVVASVCVMEFAHGGLPLVSSLGVGWLLASLPRDPHKQECCVHIQVRRPQGARELVEDGVSLPVLDHVRQFERVEPSNVFEGGPSSFVLVRPLRLALMAAVSQSGQGAGPYVVSAS
jgi:hypothetical protein